MKGLPLYLASVLKALKRFQTISAECEFNNDIISTQILLISFGNGKYSGGGFKLNPFAEIDDGLINACVIENLSKPKIIAKLPLAILGKHTKLPYAHFYKFQQAEVKLKTPTHIHIDGEVISKKVIKVLINLNRKLNVITY